MQTPDVVRPNMVAVGFNNPGKTAPQTATSQPGVLMPLWRIRTGRGPAFAHWDDALNDLLPHLGLRRQNIYEEPPSSPIGDTLSAESHNMWKQAVDQYQREGTALFDAVRPSLVLDGPYSMQDLRRVASWKRDGIKDGRSLLRWALQFADQSSLASQMQLVADINASKLSCSANLFELSEHLASLWELWLALTNSDRAKPASFFQQLLISMPTEPEGPIVHVRRWLVDLVGRGDSPLLNNIDGETGLFARMISYSESLGLKDADPSTLLALRDGAARGGGRI